MNQGDEGSSCGATIKFGDDFGDNSCTFSCGLPEGHDGEHEEAGDMAQGGPLSLPYVLRWKGSCEEANAIERENSLNGVKDPVRAMDWILSEYWGDIREGEKDLVAEKVLEDKALYDKIWKWVSDAMANDGGFPIHDKDIVRAANETIQGYFAAKGQPQ
jgi:hypothetical protein